MDFVGSKDRNWLGLRRSSGIYRFPSDRKQLNSPGSTDSLSLKIRDANRLFPISFSASARIIRDNHWVSWKNQSKQSLGVSGITPGRDSVGAEIDVIYPDDANQWTPAVCDNLSFSRRKEARETADICG
jgi:hypothetical protein